MHKKYESDKWDNIGRGRRGGGRREWHKKFPDTLFHYISDFLRYFSDGPDANVYQN
jgi:hypothetical protein